MNDSITIDGVGPMPVERPASVADLCAIVRRCYESGTAIFPVGGGTMLDYGMPPARPGIVLSTSLLNQIIDYPARDMTITVQAGITMQKLQDTLAAEGQWLPIDVAIPERSTIGGAIACDVSGPRRYGYGTLRDYVIGITVVNDRGEECKAGGRVVKNVAGYDLMKLYTGSLGTLGIIAQVTLKVRPKPESIDDLCMGWPREQFLEILERFGRVSHQPAAVAVDNADAVCWAAIYLEGSRDSVEWQMKQFRQEYASSAQFMDRRLEMPLGSDILIKVRLTPGEVANFCRCLLKIESNAIIWADVAMGELSILLATSTSRPIEQSREILNRITTEVERANGRLIVSRCPTEWKSSINIWSRPPADIALQKLIRAKFDPKRIFNPGRFVTDAF